MDNLVGQHISHYQIRALLGAGRIGSVYQAVNLRDSSLVALKTIEMDFARQSDLRLRFLQEVKAFPRLDHPSIIKIYEAGVDTQLDLLYLTMELAPGRNLNAWLQQLEYNNQQLGVAETLILAAQIAEALGYAHQKGVIHRDVRPNVILFKLDDHPEESGSLPGRAAISDFTFSTILEQEAEPYVRSLPYMAPEYFLSREADGRADLYSLGIVLYRLLTGRLPFSAQTAAEAARQHPYQEPPPPDSVRPDLPPSVTAIILKAITKNPDGRYQSGAEMAAALRKAAGTLIERREIAAPASVDADVVKTVTDPPEYAALNAIWASKEDRLTVTRNLPHSLNRQIITIGRSENNDIVLEDTAVSRLHAQLEQTPQGWTVRDLGSQNGTYLVGKPLLPDIPEEWHSHQTLRVGAYFLHLQPGKGYEYGMLSFLASVAPEEVELRAGEQVTLYLTIRNEGAGVDTFRLEMLRLPEAWVTLPAEPARLRPNEQTTLPVLIHPPLTETTLPGSYRYLLTVTSQADEKDRISIPGMVTALPAAETFTAQLLPENGRQGAFRLLIANKGLRDKLFEISADNPQNTLRYTLWQPKSGPETAVSANNKNKQQASLPRTPSVVNRLPLFSRIRSAPRMVWQRAFAVPRNALNRIMPGLGAVVPAAAMPALPKPGASAGKRPSAKPQPAFNRRAYKPVSFPAGLFAQIDVPAGQEEVVLLDVAPRKRPFYRRRAATLPFEMEIRSDNGSDNEQSQAVTGQVPVKPRLRSTPLALLLMLLILFACAFTTYAWLLRYDPVTLAMISSSNDRDGDGLSNFAETYYYETDPNNADSDGDQLSDYTEINSQLDPRQADTDGDGLNDAEELRFNTNPRQPDTDEDGLPDALEIQLGTDPLITDTLPIISAPRQPATAVPAAAATLPPPTPTRIPIPTSQTFISLAVEDGHIIQGDGGGQQVFDDLSLLQVGEGAANGSHAKGFLSFDTSAIPLGATIVSATLQLYQVEAAGSMRNMGTLQADIAPPEGFGGDPALTGSDLGATAVSLNVIPPTTGTGNGRWLNADLLENGLRALNRHGRTQFRLYFTLPNDNDNAQDWLRFAAGDADDETLRPRLVILYEW
jgi:serine/threonine protein kinase